MGFAMIPEALARDPSVAPIEMRVYAAISSYANKERSAWPGTKNLRGHTGLSERTIRRATAGLVAKGYLSTIETGSGNSANVWLLPMTPVCTDTPVPVDTPVTTATTPLSVVATHPCLHSPPKRSLQEKSEENPPAPPKGGMQSPRESRANSSPRTRTNPGPGFAVASLSPSFRPPSMRCAPTQPSAVDQTSPRPATRTTRREGGCSPAIAR